MFVGIRGRVTRYACCATALLIALHGVAAGDDAPIAEGNSRVEPAARPERIRDDELLPNVVRLHDKVFSGGQPSGEEAFKALRELGVKTIISVDGAKPDVEAAHKYGLRYVHLPHGYDGVPAARAKELAKAVRDLPGPIYIHCHHGKHRSPAAATVACVGAGLLSPELSLKVLKTAGTSAAYRGLYQSATNARRVDDTELNELTVEFRETVELPALAEAMVALEHTHDNLRILAKSGWKQLPDDPDLDAAHEALLLREHFTELLRTDDARRAPESFREYLADSEAAALRLEGVLKTSSKHAEMDSSAAARALETVSANCAACHREHRDVPLSEKGLL